MLLPLVLIALQNPAPDPIPVVDQTIYTGNVEAPTQPSRSSSSVVTRGERFEPRVDGQVLENMTSPISSLVAVRGDELNTVVGIGLITGLAGSGDSIEGARQLLKNLLLTRDINLDLQSLSSKNIAIVQVEAEIPAGMKPGRRLDVRVSTLGDSTNLQGGILTLTELTDITGRVVYATAAGPVSVGGFSVEGRNASAKKNHVTVGTLPGGGKVEREIPTSIVSDHGFIYLDLKAGQDSLGNVVRITEAVNSIYPNTAETSADGKSVRVRVLEDLLESEYAAFLYSILDQEIRSENLARIIVNERSGVIVMGGDVRLRPGAIAQGNLTVTIAETPETSQPGPLSGGTTQNLGRTRLAVEEDNNSLVLVPGAVTLKEVVEVLNILGTTPRDLISILEAMAQGGLLVAEIRRL